MGVGRPSRRTSETCRKSDSGGEVSWIGSSPRGPSCRTSVIRQKSVFGFGGLLDTEVAILLADVGRPVPCRTSVVSDVRKSSEFRNPSVTQGHRGAVAPGLRCRTSESWRFLHLLLLLDPLLRHDT